MRRIWTGSLEEDGYSRWRDQVSGASFREWQIIQLARVQHAWIMRNSATWGKSWTALNVKLRKFIFIQ